MFPWGHVAVAYLAVSMVLWWKSRTIPGDTLPYVIGVAALLPDLVDKPLAWSLGVLPAGRTLAHSLLVTIPIAIGIVWLTANRGHIESGLAFGIGVSSHGLADALQTAFSGQGIDAPMFLLWPVFSVEPAANAGYTYYFLHIRPTPFVLLELAVTMIAFGLWSSHGWPGLGWLANGVKRKVGSF